MTLRLARDVAALMKNSTRIISWDSVSHAANAGLRHAFAKFAAPEQIVQIKPFEQIAFAHKIKRRRRHGKR